MDNDIKIGQKVLVNGTNLKRKMAEGIPVNARGQVISISHRFEKLPDGSWGKPLRPSIYNVELDSGHKHGLAFREFRLLQPILSEGSGGPTMADFVEGKVPGAIAVEGNLGEPTSAGVEDGAAEGSDD